MYSINRFIIIVTSFMLLLSLLACNNNSVKKNKQELIQSYYDNGLMYYEYAIGLRGERPGTKKFCINNSINNFQKLLCIRLNGNLDGYRLSSLLYYYLGSSYFFKGDDFYQSAYRYLRTAEALNKVDRQLDRKIDEGIIKPADFNERMGRICRVLNKYDQAITYLQRSIRINPTTLNHYWLARCYHQNSNYKEALKNYELVLDREKQSQIVSRTISLLQEIYEKSGNYKKIIGLIDKQLEVQNFEKISEKSELLYKKGRIYEILYKKTKSSKDRSKYKSKSMDLFREAYCLNGNSDARLRLIRYQESVDCK